MTELSRRDWITSVGAGAVATAAAASTPLASEAGAASDSAQGLVARLPLGQALAFGWTLSESVSVRHGQMLMTLRHRSDDEEVISIRRRHENGAARDAGTGFVSTENFSIFVMDGSEGAEPTAERFGRAVRVLGVRLREAELADPEGARALSAELQLHNETRARRG